MIPELSITTAALTSSEDGKSKDTEQNTAKTKESLSPSTASELKPSPSSSSQGKRPSLKRHKDSLKESKPPNVLVFAESSTTRQSAIDTIREVLAENT